MPALDSEANAFLCRIVGNAAQRFLGAPKIILNARLAFANAFELRLHKLARVQHSDLGITDELVRVIIERTAAEMQHDEARAQLHGEINRLKRVPQRTLALALVRRGKLVAIGRRTRDLDRKRTKIVEAGK